MTHLTDDELVLHYYGEMESADEHRAESHLSTCGACQQNYTRLQRVMAFVDSAPAVDAPPGFERTAWARLQPALPARRSRWLLGFDADARTARVGRRAGGRDCRIIRRRTPAAVRPAARGICADATAIPVVANAEQVRERILLVDLGDHLDRSQMVLVELVSADDTSRRREHLDRAGARAAARRRQPVVSADGVEDRRHGDGFPARRAGAHARRHRGQPLDAVAERSGSSPPPHRVEGIAVQGTRSFVGSARAAESCHSGANGPAAARHHQELRDDHDDHETEVDHHDCRARWRSPPGHRADRIVQRRLARRRAGPTDAERARESLPSRADRDREQRDREREQRERERDQETSATTAASRRSTNPGGIAPSPPSIASRAEGTESRCGPLLEGVRAEQAGAAHGSARHDRGTERRPIPKSRYLQDAKALEVEVRRDAGQPVRPENESDEEMKLLVLNGLQNSAPDEAIPMLQKFLPESSSPKLKERALFVLAQSNSPKAREIIVGLAKGNSNPGSADEGHPVSGHPRRAGEPRRAGRCVRQHHRRRRQAAHPARVHGGRRERTACWPPRRREQNSELRMEAVRQLGVMGAHDELWTLYQKESSVDVKKQILQAMFVGGNADRLIDLAKTEQNPELRRVAVSNLGPDRIEAHRRRARRDLRHREGSRDQEVGDQRALHPEQRRSAGRHRTEGAGRDHEEGDRPEAVRDAGLEGGDRLSAGTSEQVGAVMTRSDPVHGDVDPAVATPPSPNQPRVTNGRLTNLSRSAPASMRRSAQLVAAQAEPGWIGYAVPVDRRRSHRCAAAGRRIVDERRHRRSRTGDGTAAASRTAPRPDRPLRRRPHQQRRRPRFISRGPSS